MSKVVVSFTMSLDGFIAGPHDDVSQLFHWYFDGDITIPVPDSPMVFKVAPASVEIIEELLNSYGAVVTGRRDFDVSHAWGGKSPLGVPIFIVTHSVPQEWANKDTPFTFVTEGVEHALELARRAAGTKNIAIGGTSITQQLLKAGLIDEIHIDLAPILLGQGIRLFGQLDTPLTLERTRVIAATGVTHLTFRVGKGQSVS